MKKKAVPRKKTIAPSTSRASRKKPSVKSPRSTRNSLGSVTITYDLFDLPTAQHKAGLAGLVLQIRSMTEKQPGQIPQILAMTATTATIRFTEASTQGLFDDLYAAEWVESAPQEKPRKKRNKKLVPHHGRVSITKTEKKTGKVRVVEGYTYLDVAPKLHFLEQHLPPHWLKLWRDMIFAIPREKPLTWKPYQDVANGKPYAEGSKSFWEKLTAVEHAKNSNRFHVSDTEAGLFLGSQANNAELVSFRGRSEQNLLLHFWPLAALIFVPQIIDSDGNSEIGRDHDGKRTHFCVAIPEVADLDDFCDEFPRMLDDFPPKLLGYRPASAVIDIPAQSALEFLENLARIAQHSAKKTRLKHSVNSIEYAHLVKAGNNVKTMAFGRIEPNPNLLEKYIAITGSGRSTYRNPMFRAALLQSLLDNELWYASMTHLLIQRSWPFFVSGEKTPKTMQSFSTDAETRFQLSHNEFQGDKRVHAMTTSNPTETDVTPNTPPDLLVYRLISNFVYRKSEEKSGLKWETFKKIKDEQTGKERFDVPQAYREAREKLVADTFLAMRSRREQDFVDYFTSNICSVGQFLPEDDFLLIAKELLLHWSKVKTLAMLALSAKSRL